MPELSVENLAGGAEASNIREYGPNTPEVGYGTSWLQEMPYLRDDSWGNHFRTMGFNPYLRGAWANKGIDHRGWISALHETFDKPLTKALKEYQKQGVGSDRKRFYTVQLDADFLEDMFGANGDAKLFFDSFLGVLRKAREENMVVNIFVNQYAGINKGEEEMAKQRFLTLNDKVLNLLHENNLNGSDEEIILQSIPERGKEFWLGYVDQIAELGGNAFRFSSEWSRVMNEDGSVNEAEVDDLAEIVQYARSKGVEVSMCLNHFTMPDWIKDGWLNPDIVELFGNYAEAVYNGLADRDSLPKRFLTINEAMSVLSAGYLEGSWYPYEKWDFRTLFTQFPRYSEAIANTRKAHIEAYDRVKKRREETGKMAQVGFTHNMAWYSPYMRFSPFDQVWSVIGANLADSWIGDMVGKDSLERGSMPFDFIAVQYYNEHTIGPFNGSAGSKTSVRDLIDEANRFINGWKRYPEGMLIQLMRINSMILKTASELGETELPDIMISEFGVPGLVDPREEIKVLSEAIMTGRGLSNLNYSAAIIWTLYNNYELGEGYGVNFGHKDHNGMEKEKGNSLPPKLNLKDRNIIYAVKEYEKALAAFARRLRIDESISIEDKNKPLWVADSKLKIVDDFLSALNR